MIRAAILFTAVCLISRAHAEDAPQETDLLRFLNGDQLHGGFQGVNDKRAVSWHRADAALPVEFQPTLLRQIVFHGGKTVRPVRSASHITLANGDEIPGDILSLDDKSVTIATGFSGQLRIAREHVVSLSPCPYGGKLLYHGPFSADGWEISRLPNKAQKSDPDGEPDSGKPGQEALADDPGAPAWSFSGAAWYDRGKNAALLRPDIMPDRATLRFHLAWKNRLMLAVAFHADLRKPPAKDGKEASQFFEAGGMTNYPRMFGNSYVIQIFANYVMLYRCSLTDKGQPRLERVQANGNNVHMPETGEATVELRSDRKSGTISMFLDGQFAMQWSEPAGAEYAGKGKAFGFQVPAGESTPVRISDIIVSEWNGMPDSARSMKSDDQDVLLLASGTERFSGESSRISNGTVTLRGKYGAYQIPLADCAELHLASNSVQTPSDAPKDAVRLIFQPVGRITGMLRPSPAGVITLDTSLAGTLTVPCDSANLLQFQPTEHFLDDWDPAF
jgi:hypothetical protein